MDGELEAAQRERDGMRSCGMASAFFGMTGLLLAAWTLGGKWNCGLFVYRYRSMRCSTCILSMAAVGEGQDNREGFGERN